MLCDKTGITQTDPDLLDHDDHAMKRMPEGQEIIRRYRHKSASYANKVDIKALTRKFRNYFIFISLVCESGLFKI